jgi:serine/threonine-protein kinase
VLGNARVQCYDFAAFVPRSPEEISLHTEAAGSAPPDAFGPFRVLHQIGAGALGPVFRAYDPEQDKLVAVKLFRLELPPERVHELVADFERLIAADLTHSAIVAAVGTGIVQVSPYLAQDFVAADSLDTVLREHGPAPTGEALRIVTQIAGGLDYAAVVGIVHGALHPRDVLISPDDVRLTGIGVGRALERVGVQVPVRRPYAAPERVEGGAWDRRADVFTLATLAHELLWGRRLTALGDEAAQALDELPGASRNRLRETFARALAVNPAHRYPTALEFADVLKSCFVDRPEVRAVPPQPATDYRRMPADDGATEKAVGSPHPVQAAAPLLPLVAEDAGTKLGESTDHKRVEVKAPEAETVEVRAVESAPVDELVVKSAEPIDDLTLRGPEPVVAREEEEDTPVELPELARAVAPPAIDALSEPPAPLEPPARLEAPVRLEHPISLVPPESLNPARSAVWPLTLALLVGIALGFAGGYWLGQSEQRLGQMASGGSTTAETEVRLKTDPASAGREASNPATASEAAPTGVPPVVAAPAAASPVTEPPKVPVPPEESAPRRPETPPAAAAAKPADTSEAPRTGRITVRTTPAGARVTIDGKDVGKTPLTVPNLTRGTHTVRVVRDGYTTVERRVVISPAETTSTLTLSLARVPGATPRPAPAEPAARQTAAMVVESRPPGATVFIDGKRVGTTPMSLPSMAVGSHVVRLEMSGYKSWSNSVRVVAGEKNRVAASLEQ